MKLIDHKDKRHCSALLLAASAGYTETVELLVEAGADAVMPDKRKRTPLIHAASNGHPAVLEVLLAMPGMQVDMVDQEHKTALLHACKKGHLEAGANPCSLAVLAGPVRCAAACGAIDTVLTPFLATITATGGAALRCILQWKPSLHLLQMSTCDRRVGPLPSGKPQPAATRMCWKS